MFGEASAIAVPLPVAEATASSASSPHDLSAWRDHSVSTAREMVVSGEVLQMCVETEAQSKPTLSDVSSKPAVLPTQGHFLPGLLPRAQVFTSLPVSGVSRESTHLFLISVPLSANKTHTYNAGILQTHSCMTLQGDVLIIAAGGGHPRKCSSLRAEVCAYSV